VKLPKLVMHELLAKDIVKAVRKGLNAKIFDQGWGYGKSTVLRLAIRHVAGIELKAWIPIIIRRAKTRAQVVEQAHAWLFSPAAGISSETLKYGLNGSKDTQVLEAVRRIVSGATSDLQCPAQRPGSSQPAQSPDTPQPAQLSHQSQPSTIQSSIPHPPTPSKQEACNDIMNQEDVEDNGEPSTESEAINRSEGPKPRNILLAVDDLEDLEPKALEFINEIISACPDGKGRAHGRADGHGNVVLLVACSHTKKKAVHEFLRQHQFESFFVKPRNDRVMEEFLSEILKCNSFAPWFSRFSSAIAKSARGSPGKLVSTVERLSKEKCNRPVNRTPS
jgi:hypothetical protein